MNKTQYVIRFNDGSFAKNGGSTKDLTKARFYDSESSIQHKAGQINWNGNNCNVVEVNVSYKVND